ncbi:MAG: efflux RND transporter periplasmic adaptor subunit [Planctomycetota bacterium]|jgi:RND family efflux transporter MFP subunit|nr:efflux RND transporter periplasmic adaptor subunit [Planctomycetota bacterium]
MKYLLRFVLPILILAVGLLGRSYLIATGPETQTQDPVAYAPLVEVMKLQAETARMQITAYGEVRPRATTAVVAEVAARVVEVSPKLYRGSFFKKGDVLVRLDDRDFRNAVAMAKAEVSKADAALLLEQAEARVAIADWEQLGEGPAPSLVARKPQLAAAEAARDAALANLAIANTNLSRTVMSAPFDGRSLQRNIEVGAWVAPGAALASIYAVDAAEVTLPIAASQLDNLGLEVAGSATPIKVIFETQIGNRTAHWNGHIKRTEASIDPGTRMITAIAQIDAPFEGSDDGTPALAPGMFLRATIEGRELTGVYRVPRSAVLDGDVVRVVDNASQAQQQQVKVLYRSATECLIGSGLQSGQRLVISTLPLFVPGMDVVVMNKETGAKQ